MPFRRSAVPVERVSTGRSLQRGHQSLVPLTGPSRDDEPELGEDLVQQIHPLFRVRSQLVQRVSRVEFGVIAVQLDDGHCGVRERGHSLEGIRAADHLRLDPGCVECLLDQLVEVGGQDDPNCSTLHQLGDSSMRGPGDLVPLFPFLLRRNEVLAQQFLTSRRRWRGFSEQRGVSELAAGMRGPPSLGIFGSEDMGLRIVGILGGRKFGHQTFDDAPTGRDAGARRDPGSQEQCVYARLRVHRHRQHRSWGQRVLGRYRRYGVLLRHRPSSTAQGSMACMSGWQGETPEYERTRRPGGGVALAINASVRRSRHSTSCVPVEFWPWRPN